MLLTLVFVVTLTLSVYSQDQKTEYAFVQVDGRELSQKLDVHVDFGDSPQQIEAGRLYSKELTGKKSYAAILNYMSENKFELVESLSSKMPAVLTGETSRVTFVMKRIVNYRTE